MTTIVHEYDVEYSDDCGHRWSPASLEFIEHSVKFEMLIEPTPNDKLLIATDYPRCHKFAVLRKLQCQHKFNLAQYEVKIIEYKGHRVLRLDSYTIPSITSLPALLTASDLLGINPSLAELSLTSGSDPFQADRKSLYGSGLNYSVPPPKHNDLYDSHRPLANNEELSLELKSKVVPNEELLYPVSPNHFHPVDNEDEIPLDEIPLTRIPPYSNTRFAFMEGTYDYED